MVENSFHAHENKDLANEICILFLLASFIQRFDEQLADRLPILPCALGANENGAAPGWLFIRDRHD
jgi:hypothetical protein